MLYNSKDINASNRRIGCKLVIGNTTYNNVKRLSYGSSWSGNISVGQVISSYFTATMPSPRISGNENVSLTMSIDGEETVIGQFQIDPSSIRQKQGFTTFTAYDKLRSATSTYKSSLAYPTTLQAVCNEVCGKLGIMSTTIPFDHALPEDVLSGYTLRDVLSFIGAMSAKNVYLNASGGLELRWFNDVSYSADGTNANYPFTGAGSCVVRRVVCQNTEGTLESGSGQGIFFVCPIMVKERLDWILEEVGGFTYNKADVDIPKGNFLLQSGDIINVATSNGSTIRVPIMSNSWTYDGGVRSNVSAYDTVDYSGNSNNVERSSSARRIVSIMDGKRTENKIIHQQTFLENEIKNATALITGATGGYIKLNFGGDGKTAELLVMDTPSIDTAQNVWVFNQNGLGHMYRKPDGTFDLVNLALTRDGHIVAEQIAGEKIAGVAVESTSDESQIILTDGEVKVNYSYGESVIPVAKMYYRNRKAVDDTYCFGIDVKESDGQFSIGSGGEADFFYYADKKPSGARKFNFFGDVRVENGSLYFSGININDKIADFERRIQALENK